MVISVGECVVLLLRGGKIKRFLLAVSAVVAITRKPAVPIGYWLQGTLPSTTHLHTYTPHLLFTLQLSPFRAKITMPLLSLPPQPSTPLPESTQQELYENFYLIMASGKV